MTRWQLSARAWLCALALFACSAQREPVHERAVPTITRDDASAWLHAMQRAHAQADQALDTGHGAAAASALRDALTRAAPATVRSEHARVVAQDLWFRLAQLELASEPARALQDAERGLALGRGDDLFSSNLLAVRGRALQALKRDTEAASSYHDALAIDERLLQAALARGEAEPE